MAGFNPFFKNALNVNGMFFANSSNVTFANLSINSLGFAMNTDAVVVGSNAIKIGNAASTANFHFSKLTFTDGANSTTLNVGEIRVDSVTSQAKINSTTLFIDTGNTLFGTVASLRFGNTVVNAQVTTSAIFLRDGGTFLSPTSLQVNSGAMMNATHLLINTVTTATQQATTLLTGSSANLSVFNSTANGMVLAANDSGTPISTNVHFLTGNGGWRKGYVWQKYYAWSSATPSFTWEGNTFSVIDVSGWIRGTGLTGFFPNAPEYRIYFHFNGSVRTSSDYYYNGRHFWTDGEHPLDDDNENGAGIAWNEDSGDKINYNLRFFNCEGQEAVCHYRASTYSSVGRVRIWDGWIGFDSTVPNGNGVTGFQFFFSNNSSTRNHSGNLIITGVPF